MISVNDDGSFGTELELSEELYQAPGSKCDGHPRILHMECGGNGWCPLLERIEVSS